ncbi:MAG TPA: EFR1 family ferrodoxin [Spirochaetota bacterium]|nr:EFR1 family ferrodoxin [Spirochaetota bacterium]
MFRKLVIYYLTGTGNALKAARWFEDLAQARGMTAVLIPIDRFRRPIAPPPSEDTLVGFLFPTHGFCLPWYMLKFMLAFPRGRNRLFCLNTYAGTTLGRIALPGLSGLALILPAIVMSLKGYQVRGLVSLNLPSNWISLHPGLTDHAVSVLVEHCKKKTGKYAEALFSGGRALQGLISLPFDLAVSPVAVGYLFVGHFWLAKMYMASSDCDGCAICANSCPMNALVMKNGRPYWTFHCESCMRCINICPKKAIQVSYVFTAVSAYLLYGVLFPAAVMLAAQYNETAASFITSASYGAGFIRAWIILSVMFLLYRLVLRLTRFKPFELVFARFTPTSFRFWRRYLAPGIGVKDFRRKG